MKSAQDLLDEVTVIVNNYNESKPLGVYNAEEAKNQKAKMIQFQKQLRLLKKEIVSTRKMSNAQYETQKANTNSGCVAVLFGRGFARSVTASNKRTIQNQKLQESSKYDFVIRSIDDVVIQLDHTKVKLDKAILTNNFDD